MVSVQNPKINWKENSRVRTGRIAFTAEASNLKIGRYSCNPKTISGVDYSTKNDELRKDSLNNSTILLRRGLSTGSLLYYRSLTGSRKKRT